jgi:lipoate---protein ligase
MTWRVEEATGDAGEFHARPLPDPPTRTAWFLQVRRPALVLGSIQPPETADEAACAARGVEIVRRRSGGGAVLLVPGEALWLDIVLPRDDPLWDDDVGRAAHWVGELWASALDAVGVRGSRVHRRGLVRARWSDLVCFAGHGPGEVIVDGGDGGGGKVVGISQRRTREAARFQCVALARWQPEQLLALLALGDDVRREAAEELRSVATGAPLARLHDALVLQLGQLHRRGGG